MKIFFIWLAASFVSSECFSQKQWPAVYRINSDTADWMDITTSCWIMLEDKDGKWDLNDVSKLHEEGKFHSIGTSFDSTVHTYWIAYRLHNVMNSDARVSLNSMCDFDDFYVKSDSGDWRHFISGKLNDWKNKNGLKIADCIPVEMHPGETYTIYQRMSNTKPGLPEYFQVAIVNTDKVIREFYIDDAEKREKYFYVANIQEAFIIGMIFLSAFMNFFFYRIVKEKVYLYFALFTLFLGINRCYGISFSYFNVFDQRRLQYVAYLGYAWIFISFFLVQFFRNFLNSKKRFPRVDKWLLGLIIVFLVFDLIKMLLRVFEIQSLPWFRVVSSIYTFFFIPCVLLILQLLCLKQGKANRFVLFGSLPLLSHYILSQFFTPDGLNISPANPIIRSFASNFRLIEAISLALMLVSFTWVLLMRFIDLRKENSQQALDKERLSKEKEIEKNELIAAQKIQLEKDVAERTGELKQSLEELKAAQSQLIQSEKMASLGELTAGIAHEIQNPLNFVNNFSEVSNELVDEMNIELEKGAIAEAKTIANDIKQNLEKINHHGKRADAIVKGMLQHSRSSGGVKEPTDLNNLADEYFRLAYHGLRAKDKSFNATLVTDFDESIGKISIIPQDIGRVILNLINNAFYAVDEKKKQTSGGYEPSVSVTTKKVNGWVEIVITDNGNGISKKVVDKIFQPFFTTKPTGQGTGLGLSLAYDIIKAHGGEIKVETRETEGTTFSVQLPHGNHSLHCL